MRLRSATVLVAALALAAGCSGSSKPQTLPSLAPTPSATVTAVVVPSAATVHDAFGAAAFVRFYYDQLNKAYQTADAGLLSGLSDAACSTCSGFAKAIEDIRAKRQHLVGLAVRVLSAEAPPEQAGIVAVDVQADAPPRTLVDANNKIVDRGSADPPYHVTVFVKRVQSGWVVRAVKRS